MSAWDEIVIEVVEAAKVNMSMADFTQSALLYQPLVGYSPLDRLQVLRNLIAGKVVDEVNGKLVLVTNELALNDIVRLGLEQAWAVTRALTNNEEKLSKFDALAIAAIGFRGEEFIIEQLRRVVPQDLHHLIVWRSLVDDSAGFDIECPNPESLSEILKLEVKTSTRDAKDFSFFVSKNEMKVGSNYSGWRLVAVQALPSQKLLGALRASDLQPHLPAKTSIHADWETARFTVPNSWWGRLEGF